MARCAPTKKTRGPLPPYTADGCAWQTRQGRDGRMYTSQPNDLGQFVWVLKPPTRGERLKKSARTLAREYAPLAASKAASIASRHLYQTLLPGHNYDNAQAVFQGRQYYDPYYA